MTTQKFSSRTKRIAIAIAGAAALVPWLLSGTGIDRADTAAQAQATAATAPDPTLRLISQSQYVSSISHIFGSDISVRIRFAPVNRTEGLLAVGASNAVLTSGGLDPLYATGKSIAEQVVDEAHRPYLVPCKPANPRAADPACASAFFSKVGRMLYRRPLAQDELGKLVDTAGRSVGPAGDFYAGLAFALSGMMVSPKFLYIRETTEPDPTTAGGWRLDADSKAARLSFLLWNASPDEALLDAAARGDLHRPDGLRKEVDRMVASPRYREGVRAFFSDFFVLETFDNLSKDSTIYPAFSLKAVDEAREQILRTAVDHLVGQHGDYRDLFTTHRVAVSSELAVLYRLPVNLGSTGWTTYQFPPNDPRAGLLTQIGFLAQYAHPGRSSSTRRGRAIREVLLCQKVPDPPPNVDFSNFENPKTSLPTARQRLSIYQENPVCAGCHRITDPIGLALENFDGAGQFRAIENGTRIDASGSLDGTSFSDPSGLGKAVREHPALKSCIVNRLYGYSVGRKVSPGEEALLQQYQGTLDKSGYRFDDMLRLIILDKRFFSVRAPQVASVSPLITASQGGSHADQD